MDIDLTKIEGKEFSPVGFFEITKNIFVDFKSSNNNYGSIVRDSRGYRNVNKLVDEIIPIALYLKYSGLCLDVKKIKWMNGSQKGDAIITANEEEVLEVTTVRHKNEHLRRFMVNQSGYSFGASGVKKDEKTGKLKSLAVGDKHSSFIIENADWIKSGISKKVGKYGHRKARLIVNVYPDGPMMDEDIMEIQHSLETFQLPECFLHVYVCFSGSEKGLVISPSKKPYSKSSL